jgi:hypothetical protein
MLKKIIKLLEPQGCVIVSVPNIAHLSVSLPLLLLRRFDYRDAGILDRTHLRFFVKETAIKLLNNADLIVTKALISGIQGPRTKILDRLSGGLLRHHLARQYIMRGELNNQEISQPRIRWMVAE